MKKLLFLSFLLLSLVAISQTKENIPLKPGLNNSVIKFRVNSENISTNAIIWLPAGFQKGNKYPLVVYGHSSNQAGTDINNLYREGLPAVLKQGYQPEFNCIIICPQRASISVQPSWLMGLFEYAGQNFNIDTNRIYLTGNSTGGLMCFGSLTNISEELTHKIAAVCILSGETENVDQKRVDWWVKSRTPVWAIVGRNNTGNFHQNIAVISAINKRVPNLGRLTILPSVESPDWIKIYSGQFTENGETIWSWLYKKDLEKNKVSENIGKRILLRFQNRQVYCKDVARDYSPLPGDTLVIPSGLQSFLIQNFVGSAEKPIVIIPEDSGWIGGYSSYSANVSKASYFKITGFHIDGLNRSGLGLVVGEEASNYEIGNCYIKNIASIGLMAKHNPNDNNESKNWPNFVIRDVVIHDLIVKNTGTEAMYIGYTFDKVKPLAPPFDNLRIYNIDTDSSGWDGLQISNCQNVTMQNVKISNYGLKNKSGQQAGLLIGGMVTFKNPVSHIKISNGTGSGLVIFGRGKMFFNDMTLKHTGLSEGENAVYVNDYQDLGYGLPPLQINMKNIKVEGSNGNALLVVNKNKTMVPGKIEKFVFSNTKGGISDNVNTISR